MVIIKKDGTKEPFDNGKVLKAIEKSAARVMHKITEPELNAFLAKLESALLNRESIPVSDMHNAVEAALESVMPDVAKSYKDYRNYKTDFVYMLDDVYQKAQSIMYIGDKDNANTDSALVATKRSLVFNALNKELYKKFFLTTEELQNNSEETTTTDFPEKSDTGTNTTKTITLECHIESFECGYVSQLGNANFYPLLISTKDQLINAESEYVLVVSENYNNNTVAEVFQNIKKNYPIEEYDYLVEYMETTCGGYYYHADKVLIIEDKIGFHLDSCVGPSSEEAATEVMGGFCHIAAIPKSELAGKTFSNVSVTK